MANAIFHRFRIVQDPGQRNTTRLMRLNGIAILGGPFLMIESDR